MALHFKPLHPSFGAEVTDFNCGQDVVRNTESLKGALTRWQLLLFREQDLTDGAFVEFCRAFGDLELLPEPEKRHPEYPEIFNLSNIRPDGSLTPKDDPQAVFLRGTSRWHTDSSFRKIPCLATILYAVTIPPEGGDTEFANMIAAFDSLSGEEKGRLRQQKAVHSYAYSRSANPGELEEMSAEELAKVPDTHHPIIRRHDGDKAVVYLGGHVSHIEGKDVTESRAEVRALEDRLTNVGNVYRHQWREGDVLIWDNRSTLHRLTGYEIDKYARVMRRCTVRGTETVNAF